MRYVLPRPFWNGEMLLPRGSIVDFPEGGAPRGSKPEASAVEPEPEPELSLGLPKGTKK